MTGGLKRSIVGHVRPSVTQALKEGQLNICLGNHQFTSDGLPIGGR